MLLSFSSLVIPVPGVLTDRYWAAWFDDRLHLAQYLRAKSFRCVGFWKTDLLGLTITSYHNLRIFLASKRTTNNEKIKFYTYLRTRKFFDVKTYFLCSRNVCNRPFHQFFVFFCSSTWPNLRFPVTEQTCLLIHWWQFRVF